MERINDRPYNYQNDNKAIHAIAYVDGSAQCGYTALCVAISKETSNDAFVFKYGSMLESPSPMRSYLLKKLVQKENGQRLGASSLAYFYSLQYLNETKQIRTIQRYVESAGTLEGLKEAIDNGYCLVLSTMLTGAGHFITVLGYDDAGNLICHDPAGNHAEGYFNKNGGHVRYNIEKMKAYLKPPSFPWYGGFRYIAVKPV